MPESGPQIPESGLERLLRLYQQGDAAAAAALVRAVSPMFARYCRRLGDPPQEVEDILQEIWMRVHKARHTYREGAAAAPWLYAIARHSRLDARRARQKRGAREIPMEPLPEIAAPSNETRGVEMEALLDGVPPAEREALFLLKERGMSLKEAAQATSSTVGAVKQRAYRAYQRIRTAWDGAAGRRS